MAYGNMTAAVSGQPASAAANNQIIINVDDLDTRLDAAEATVNASGATAAGNAALSSRLGTGVTTSSTATAQLNALSARVSAVEAVSGTGTATVLSDPGNSGTVTSSAYVEARTGASSEAGVAFVAPASGAVKITWAAGITSAAVSGTYALASIVVRTGNAVGSGTVFRAANDNTTCQNTGVTAENTYSNFYLMTGLTPGNPYNVRLAYRVRTNGETGTFNRPKVLVEPVLAV